MKKHERTCQIAIRRTKGLQKQNPSASVYLSVKQRLSPPRKNISNATSTKNPLSIKKWLVSWQQHTPSDESTCWFSRQRVCCCCSCYSSSYYCSIAADAATTTATTTTTTTGDHSNQDLRSALKPIYSPFFANHIWSWLLCPPVIGCLRYTKLCWVAKHINIIMKPTNPPTQGQPNPWKIRLKVAFGPLFPTAKIIFRGLGLVLYRKQTTRILTQPDSAPTPL